MSKILIALTILAVISLTTSTICRDGSQCSGTSTCCLTPQGVGCCPYENASCCADGLHCCPNGFTCDTTGARCVKSSNFDEFLSFLETEPSTMTSANLSASIDPTLDLFSFLPNFDGISPADLMKCVSDIRPVVSDVIDIVKSYKDGDKSAIEKLILKITADGLTLSKDCWKIIEDLKK